MATKTRKTRVSRSAKSGGFVAGATKGTGVTGRTKGAVTKYESQRGDDASPVGRAAKEGAAVRAERSEDYREARDEYAAIRQLREKNWIAAHIRERRYELEMTQEQVAQAANTSHSYISRVEKGDYFPTMHVLQRILAVLDEELLIGIAERGGDDDGEREIAPLPALASV